MLHILHLNSYDAHGGAEKVCARLVERQRSAGHEVTLLAGTVSHDGSGAVPLRRQDKIALPVARGFPDYDVGCGFDLPQHPLVRGASVLHLHNAYGGWLNPLALPALSHAKPLVWTLHDMQPISGYCSHSLDCERWTLGCGECPDLTLPGPSLERDITAEIWRDRALISAMSRFHLVACSEWARGNISRSLLSQHPVEVIPNGVDTTAFQPRDRAEARRRLGLPEDAVVLGSVAGSGVLSNRWKGGLVLKAALDGLMQRGLRPVFLDVGARDEGAHPLVREVPFVRVDDEMARIYAAMDVFVFPSLAENMPLSTLEAMACGIPVVATRVGGLPEQIADGVNGLLIPSQNAEALTGAIETLIRDAELRAKLGAEARERVVRDFDFTLCASRHEALYSRIADQSHRGASETELLKKLVVAEQACADAQIRLKETQRKRKADQAREEEANALLRRQSWLGTLVKTRLVPAEFRRWWEKRTREK